MPAPWEEELSPENRAMLIRKTWCTNILLNKLKDKGFLTAEQVEALNKEVNKVAAVKLYEILESQKKDKYYDALYQIFSHHDVRQHEAEDIIRRAKDRWEIKEAERHNRSLRSN